MLLLLTCQFIIICPLITFCSSENELPVVDSPLGRVRGFWKTSVNGRNYAAFEGIPYAQPPVGDLRFEEPRPIKPWSGTWAADTLHTCIQNGFTPSGIQIQGKEDCLYLNIYLPAEFLNNPKKLEVIVSIHGGAFMFGSGHTLTESSNFMDKDIVLVTINYRVGILGFLSTEDEAVPGNNGLKDQVVALKWVRDNIAFFGGNPDSVTIIGLSAGGVSVHFHYLSPLSRGLFHRGVAQSGTALVPWAIRRNPLKHAKKLGELVGCHSSSTEELKSCLKQRPAETVLKELPNFYVYNSLPFSPFAPAIEKTSATAFLDEEPYWVLKNGNVADVPLITSTTADEGILLTAMFWSKLEELDEDWDEIPCVLLDCSDTLPESKRENVAERVLSHYLGKGERINRKNFKKFTQIFTDRLFAYPAALTAKLQAAVTKSPVYYYFFNYQEGENKLAHFFAQTDEVEGVAHCEDCIYCYGIFQIKPLSKQDQLLRDECQNMFYTFATSGTPSLDGTDIWEPTKSGELVYLNVTGPENIKLRNSRDFASSDFWGSLGFLENEDAIVKDELYANDLPEVHTPLGRVRGFWKTSSEGRKYAAFEGIPYAKPPIGDLRFEDAVSITAWAGIWEANNPQTCLQFEGLDNSTEGNEDCLYLNVYIPSKFLNSSKKRDVVVQFHGGGFNVGSAHGWIHSQFFMDKDIVLVTPNYRLGLLGFLSTEDDVIPGNNGLKDQVLALKWVKKNIASFGGNPNSVTIDGHSAGGASVHFHYFSPLSRGLFRRGLSRSGTALGPWAIQENMAERTKQLAAIVGCPTNHSKALKKCLKQRPTQSLLAQIKHLYGYDSLPMTIFAPVIEKGVEKPFLNKHPYLLLREGRVLDVPWVTSMAADDGLLPTALFWNKLDEINDKWPAIFQYLLECNHTLPQSERTVSRKILDFYLGSGENISKQNFDKFTQVFTDRYFGVPAEISAKLQANVTKSPVYFYFFNYRGGENVAVNLLTTEELDGVSHGEDMIYLNGVGVVKPFSTQDELMKKALHGMLYSFLSSGIPSFKKTEIWQPTEASQLTYLNITGPEKIKLQTVHDLTPIDFWKGLGLLEFDNITIKNKL